MDKRVTLEMRGKSPSQIKELVLDNCRSTTVTGITDEFCNLEKLSLINIGLTNLKGFPKLPNLRKLELSDNRISGGLENISANCPKLKSLYLSGNKIDEFETLEPLKDLSELEHLDLQTCKVTQIDEYEEKVFALLPQLKFLDGFDHNGAEAEESDVENGESSTKVNASNSKEDADTSESDSEEDDDEDEEGSSGEDVGLDYLMKNQIDEESEENDYHPDDADSDADDIESDEEESPARGQKRKLENDE